jgi:hypothetical protein
MRTAAVRLASLKVTVPLKPEQLPRDLVPPEGPPGEPLLDLVLEGGVTVRARLNGRNYRRMMKQVDEAGAAGVVIILQGVLKPPTEPGGPHVLADAGFQVSVKTPKSAPEAAPAPAAGRRTGGGAGEAPAH